MNQKFGVGDLAVLDDYLVEIVMPIRDEDGNWWYEVEAIDLDEPYRSFHREVKQEQLKSYKGENK